MEPPISRAIDAAICDLISDLSNYSDPYFDVQCINLSEDELNHLVVLLLDYWRSQLDGRVLASLLLTIRSDAGDADRAAIGLQ